jgi:hypothetical protein
MGTQWYIGVILSLIGSIISNLGLNLQKWTHVRLARKMAHYERKRRRGLSEDEDYNTMSEFDMSPSTSESDDDDNDAEICKKRDGASGGGGRRRSVGADGQDSQGSNVVKLGMCSSRYYCQSSWLVGISLVILGAICDFTALGFASQTIVAPLGSITLVSNLFFAVQFSGETWNRKDLMATCVIILGSAVSVAFGNREDQEYELDELFAFYSDGRFFVYCLAISVFVGVFYRSIFKTTKLLERLAHSKINQETIENLDDQLGIVELIAHFGWGRIILNRFTRFGYCFIAGVTGAQSVMFAKGVSLGLRDGVGNFLSRGGSYGLLAGLGITIFLQIKWLNEGLMLFDAIYVVPVFQSFWISFAVLSGMIVYKETEAMSWLELAMFSLGILIMLSGVIQLSRRSGLLGLSSSSSNALTGESDHDDQSTANRTDDGMDGDTTNNSSRLGSGSGSGGDIGSRKMSRVHAGNAVGVDDDVGGAKDNQSGSGSDIDRHIAARRNSHSGSSAESNSSAAARKTQSRNPTPPPPIIEGGGTSASRSASPSPATNTTITTAATSFTVAAATASSKDGSASAAALQLHEHKIVERSVSAPDVEQTADGNDSSHNNNNNNNKAGSESLNTSVDSVSSADGQRSVKRGSMSDTNVFAPNSGQKRSGSSNKHRGGSQQSHNGSSGRRSRAQTSTSSANSRQSTMLHFIGLKPSDLNRVSQRHSVMNLMKSALLTADRSSRWDPSDPESLQFAPAAPGNSRQPSGTGSPSMSRQSNQSNSSRFANNNHQSAAGSFSPRRESNNNGKGGQSPASPPFVQIQPGTPYTFGGGTSGASSPSDGQAGASGNSNISKSKHHKLLKHGDRNPIKKFTFGGKGKHNNGKSPASRDSHNNHFHGNHSNHGNAHNSNHVRRGSADIGGRYMGSVSLPADGIIQSSNTSGGSGGGGGGSSANDSIQSAHSAPVAQASASGDEFMVVGKAVLSSSSSSSSGMDDDARDAGQDDESRGLLSQVIAEQKQTASQARRTGNRSQVPELPAMTPTPKDMSSGRTSEGTSTDFAGNTWHHASKDSQ